MVHSNEIEASQELEKITLQFKWPHQFQFAGYYAAIDQGYYAEEGLDVHIQTFDQQKNIVQQVVSGDVDYGVGNAGILFSYAKGEPIKALAAIFQHNPSVFISKKTSGIISPFEMIDKRIMLKSVETDEALLKVILADAQITNPQYIATTESYNIDDFISGKVDVISGYLSNAPFVLKQRGKEVNIINPQSYGIDFYGDILFTSNQEIDLHPGRAKRFLRASLKGWEYAFKNPEELIYLIKNKYISQSSIAQLKNEVEEMRKLILPDTIPLGQINEARLRNMADLYTQSGLARTLTDSELANFIYIKNNKLNLNDQELTWLQENPVINLGVAHNFMPYQWINRRGNFEGIAADYIALLEQRLGVTFKVRHNKKTWPDVLKATKEGKVDMLACAVKTPSRETYLNFSKPYLNSFVAIISEQSNSSIGTLKQLAGKRVAIQKGNYIQEILAKDHPNIIIILTHSITEALRMVSEGKADAYIGDVTAASHFMKMKGFLNLVFSGSTPYQSQFSFATHKNKPMLTSIINKGLASISQNERHEIYNHWRALKVTQGIQTKTIIKYALAIFSLFLLFAYWVYRLRHSEAALKRSEAKLQLILDTEPEGVTVIDSAGYLVQINPAGLSMVGLNDVTQAIGKQVTSLVVDGDKQAFIDMNNRVLNGETCSLEYQVKGEDGIVRWMGSHAVPLVDEKNKSISILAVTSDITERKKIGKEQKIAALVYQNSSESMIVLDRYNLIIAINPAFSKTTGYSLNELEGRHPKLLLSEENNSLNREMKDSIKGKGHWEGEILAKRKNGDSFPIRIIINTIFTNDGVIEHRVALFSDITDQKETEKLIWNQANFDPLTDLPNRHLLLDHLNQDIKLANRESKRLAVIFLDLDHFKEVNDTLGHDAGDVLLSEAANRLKSCVRESDTVARLGGDEFIIVLADLDELHNIDRVALDIIEELTKPFNLYSELTYVSASLGIALYPADAKDSEGLIKYADQAMYLSKQRGRGCFSYFTQSMQEQANSRMQLLNSIRWALAEKQFELYYQPIVDLKTGEIVKAEALIRWNHPTKGVVGPTNFIAIAEDSGLIIDIGDWVYKKAAQQVKIWRELFNTKLQVSVNKSPVQFRAATDRDDWLKYLKTIGLAGDGIVIEITEGLLMDNASNVTHQLLQYRDAGIQVALDDFGTGYSALSYLNKFDIDYLKIDRSFTRNITPGSNDMALSEAIIVMSHKLGLNVIAEGIETEEQRQLLLSAGCNYGQGYLFSKPVPAAKFEKMLKDKIIVSNDYG
ncbi:MAG: EAL domain-containing protein [Methylococcales bacterium]|nr:EAL domain-containing protein [Methylococcales bacterium]